MVRPGSAVRTGRGEIVSSGNRTAAGAGTEVRRPSEPQEMLVVIPARNEEDRLPGCLAAISVAMQRLPTAAPPVRVVVVLDSCTDASSAQLERAPWAQAIHCEVGMVGAARALGIDRSLQDGDWSWIACTDADTLVPPDWLHTQLAAARSGVDLLLGTVRPDHAEVTPSVLQRWMGFHQISDGHPHIHGANMGLRSDMYRMVGGFAAVAEHEDVMLANQVRATGARVVSTGASPVLTSGRTLGRTPGGMAGYLMALTSAATLLESDRNALELS